MAGKTLKFLAPFRWAIAAIVPFTIVLSAMDAVEPLLMKLLFDSVAEGKSSLHTLGMAAGGLIGLGFASQALGGLLNWLIWRVRMGVDYNLRSAVVEHLYSLPLSFFRVRSVGGIVTQVNRSIEGYMEAFAEVTTRIFPNLVYLSISLVSMYMLDTRLFLLALGLAPLPTLLGSYAATEQTEREQKLLGQWTRIFSRFHETLAGIAVVKIFNREQMERQWFMGEIGKTNRIVLRGVARDTCFSTGINLLIKLGRVATALYGIYLVIRGEITVGTVVAFLGYLAGLFGPVQGLTGTYQTLRRTSVFLRSIFEILDAPDPLCDRCDAKPFDSLCGSIEFKNVTFAYNEAPPAVRNINLKVGAGECVALVGPSGAGKTTLVSLLQRFDDPTCGAIYLDGTDIRTIGRESLRRRIGCVLQESLIFNDTVRNNIAYGKPNASPAEVEAAACAANAHDFIMKLPEGYDTVLGERGCRLSSGQRQRLAIARALIKNPQILILDEATSALDAECESLVQDALNTLVHGRTTVVIAHRLHTIVNADRIVLIRDGQIVQEGSHEKLMRENSYYASLVEKQTNGLLIPDLCAA